MSLSYKWTEIICDSRPLERSSHEISYIDINNKIFLFGGENIPRNPIDEGNNVYILDIENKKWDCIATNGSPPIRLAHGQCVIDNKVYIFGGRQGVQMGEGALSDLYYYDIISNQWNGPIESKGGIVPEIRSFHKIIGIDKKIYVFGGCSAEGRLNDLHVLDTETLIWKELPACEAASGRGGPALGVSKDLTKLILATGYSGQENDDIHIFDINNSNWISRQKGQMRARSVAPHCTLCPNDTTNVLVIFGGEVNTSDRGHEGAGDFADDLVIIDTETGIVLPCNNVGHCKPEARGWTSMTKISNNKAILFGGLSGNDDNPIRRNDSWLLEII